MNFNDPNTHQPPSLNPQSGQWQPQPPPPPPWRPWPPQPTQSGQWQPPTSQIPMHYSPRPGAYWLQPPGQPVWQTMKPYSSKALYTLIGAYGAFWLLCLIGQGNGPFYFLGICLCMGLALSVLILDARGLVSLQRPARKGSRKTLLFTLLALFAWPLWLGVYLLCTFLAYHRPPLVSAPARRKATIAFSVGTAITLFLSIATLAGTTAPTQPITTTATGAAASIAPITPTVQVSPTPRPKPKPTQQARPTPTPVPTTQPTAPPPPAPTQPPAQASGPTYNFNANGGQLIYHPPADFCDQYACIASFWKGVGYVVECSDGDYSLSGGRQGVCSYHGGYMKTLYQH